MSALERIENQILKPRTEEELLDYKRLELKQLAEVHGTHFDVALASFSGRLSPQEQLVCNSATALIMKQGVQYF